jgi:gas vesicle protein
MAYIGLTISRSPWMFITGVLFATEMYIINRELDKFHEETMASFNKIHEKMEDIAKEADKITSQTNEFSDQIDKTDQRLVEKFGE